LSVILDIAPSGQDRRGAGQVGSLLGILRRDPEHHVVDRLGLEPGPLYEFLLERHTRSTGEISAKPPRGDAFVEASAGFLDVRVCHDTPRVAYLLR